MLVLSRKVGEDIVIGGDIVVKVLSVGSGKVKVGIEAPKEVRVTRGELQIYDDLVAAMKKDD